MNAIQENELIPVDWENDEVFGMRVRTKYELDDQLVDLEVQFLDKRGRPSFPGWTHYPWFYSPGQIPTKKKPKHTPLFATIDKFNDLLESFKNLPPSKEVDRALVKVQEALFWLSKA